MQHCLRCTGSFARRNRAMIMTNKLLPVALIAALIGGSVGALVMHQTQPATAETTTTMTPAQDMARNAVPATTQQASYNEMVPAEFNTAGEQTAYKTGFADGFAAAQGDQRTVAPAATRRTSNRVVY